MSRLIALLSLFIISFNLLSFGFHHHKHENALTSECLICVVSVESKKGLTLEGVEEFKPFAALLYLESLSAEIYQNFDYQLVKSLQARAPPTFLS